ncbi:MAG: phosphoglycerate mutase family protein [Bacteroidota bacterium]
MEEFIKLKLPNIFQSPFVFLLFFLGLGCNDLKQDLKTNTNPIVSTFYLIRHSEKDRSNPENLDPELNQDGLGRAMKWAEILDPVPIDVIYSTNYERTTMTAAPTSVKKDIDVKYYDPNSLDIEEFKTQNEGLNVLVVGHSNTTPELVNKLLGIDKYDQMEDDDNGSLFIVRITDGKTTDFHLNMD